MGLVPESGLDPMADCRVGVQGLVLLRKTIWTQERKCRVADPLSPVRIALIGCTGLLGDVICQTLTAEPDLRVVAELTTPAPGLDICTVDADIVLWKDADEQRIALWLSHSRDSH